LIEISKALPGHEIPVFELFCFQRRVDLCQMGIVFATHSFAKAGADGIGWDRCDLNNLYLV
jgi:hypothetical protein